MRLKEVGFRYALATAALLSLVLSDLWSTSAIPSKASKSAAHEIACTVSGVTRVENQIEVVSSARNEAVEASDHKVRAGFKKTLNDCGEQESADVAIEVKIEIVRLTGTVPSWQRNPSDVYAARSMSGVRSVRSELHPVPPKAKHS